jgi:hypothetical protein
MLETSMSAQRTVWGALAAGALVALLLADSVTGQQPLDLPPLRDGSLRELCGTGQDRLRQIGALQRLVAVTPGQPLSYRQEPPILTPDYTDAVTLRAFTLVGDVPTVRFKPAFEGSAVETWTRTAVGQVNGRMVSLFEPSWPSSVVDQVLSRRRWGWDLMGVYWGELLTEGIEPGAGRSVYLRMAPTSLPPVQVWRPAGDVQYSSHVVNLMIPGFGDGVIDDEYGFDLVGVASKFYQSFADSYDTLAIVPDQTLFLSYGAFHRNVQNAVRGIGIDVFDNSLLYGSRSHRLRGIEVFNSYFATGHALSAHEIAHQWGSYIDWSKLNGLVRAGHQPASHDPLWAEGETLIGSVLSPYRRVARGGAGWEIQRTPAPVRFHPYSLYAMGLIPKEAVPEVTLFDQQDQFDPLAMSTPDIGKPVVGTARTATVYNVIGMLGERSGPVDTQWHRATIVVTRDRLLTDFEMRYWTFAARRLEDPNGAGVVGFDGAASFDVATSRAIDLHTDIRPLSGQVAVDPFDVDYPLFGRSDWRDVAFDDVVPSHYRIGERARWSGVVRARDRSDINQILIRFTKAGGGDDAIRVTGAVSSRSSFLLDTQFEPRQAGTYMMEVFLFWPDSGPQYSRAALSPVVID